MAQLFNYSGDEDFLPLGQHVDVYYPCKPLVPFEARLTSIDFLPDECLFEIFRRLPGDQERSACACVSKRWLVLLSSIQSDELSRGRSESKENGFLKRCLEGKEATDVRLAAIAVRTSPRGGLGELIIKGSSPSHGVRSLGLRAIARCCPALRVLSLWNAPSIVDEGLIEIANGCNQLEKLDLIQCPLVTDSALVAIAKGSPNLTCLTIDSCQNIGNESLQAFAKFCPDLKSVSIKDCPLVGDQGIMSLLSSPSNVLSKVKLQGLQISDVSLAVIGHYCRSVTDLILSGLENVNERGFWWMGNACGLQMLKNFTIASCRGVTDLGLQSVGTGCTNLKSFCLRNCVSLSGNGLVSFAKSAMSLESLELEECDWITEFGFFNLLLYCGANLKALAVSNCSLIKDMHVGVGLPEPASTFIQSLTVRNCPFFGDVNLGLLSTLCPQLQALDLSGLARISDHGVTPLIESSDAGLVKVKLGGCVNLTDDTALALAGAHGGTLKLLSLEGCRKITDASLVAIADECLLLKELDVSRCAVSFRGVSALSRAKQLTSLRILSLSGCTRLSDKSRRALAKLGRSLICLNLQNCNGISISVVDMLVARLRNCDILC